MLVHRAERTAAQRTRPNVPPSSVAALDLRIVKPTADYRIDIDDLARVIDRKTRLVELSSTTMYNGFQHDLKAVCELAHSHGAYVYADMIHTAGAEPFDVKASGVDFAACSSFKWLTGDYGLGFLYARDDLVEHIRRPLIGYYQAATMTGHEPPFDSAGASAPFRGGLRAHDRQLDAVSPSIYKDMEDVERLLEALT